VAARVDGRLDGDPHVGALHLGLAQRADPVELRVTALAEEELVGAVEVDAEVRMASGREHASPNLVHERRRRRRRIDADQVALADPGRVVDQDAG
jgi:hypothetical protein